jgi:hypothetical protein
MTDRDDLLRVDKTGTVHPVGRTASQELRQRAGEWRLVPGPREIVVMRSLGEARALKLAGEIRTPGALCDVVALAAQSGWKGELVIYSEAGMRSFFFEGGNVITATTTVPEERLGETLYRFGVITREQLEAIVKSSSATGKRVGEAAIDLEYVTAEELYPMMARQVEEVFYAALQLGEGTFYFFDRYDEKTILRRHNINAGALLMDGARRMDELKFFREKVPNDTYIPVPVGPGKRPPDELMVVYAQCDGKRSIADIGRRIGQLEFEVTRAVFQLINAGFVTMQASRPRGAEAIVETYNPALSEIHAACDAAGKGAELRDGLARFATGGGVYDPLFMMAGPAADGSLKPERVARNLAALAGEDPDAWLIQLMNEYVGFALFQAESLVPRDSVEKLSQAVGEMLKTVRPLEGATALARTA